MYWLAGLIGRDWMQLSVHWRQFAIGDVDHLQQNILCAFKILFQFLRHPSPRKKRCIYDILTHPPNHSPTHPPTAKTCVCVCTVRKQQLWENGSECFDIRYTYKCILDHIYIPKLTHHAHTSTAHTLTVGSTTIV